MFLPCEALTDLIDGKGPMLDKRTCQAILDDNKVMEALFTFTATHGELDPETDMEWVATKGHDIMSFLYTCQPWQFEVQTSSRGR